MTVLIVWGAAVLVALVVGGVLGYELLGHLRRLGRTAEAARQDLQPRLGRLRPPGTGRHRAGMPRP